jgi:lipoyl(octanoyl) transferase
MQKVIYRDLGRMAYQEAWDYQTDLFKKAIALKLQNRTHIEKGEPIDPVKHFLLFCEHQPVYTLGKSGSMDHLLKGEDELSKEGVSFFKINRGGDITYHGPGQITGYPVFDLDEFFTDVHKYVRFLEEAIIRTLSKYGIKGERDSGYTGVWLPESEGKPRRKICAIGVHMSRWVTMHGFAFNVNTDLGYFNNIVPCGIDEPGRDVTSLQAELGRVVDMEEVKDFLKKSFAEVFEFEFEEAQ